MQPTLLKGPFKSLGTRLFACALCVLGFAVLFSWHYPALTKGLYPHVTLMAYNAALGFCACGLGLFSAIIRSRVLNLISAGVVFFIGCLTLLDLFTSAPLDTTQWFVQFLSAAPAHNKPVSPAASLAFVIASAVIVLGFKPRGALALVTCILCIVIFFITLIAILGQGFGVLPQSVWLGINMAPHTAAGFILFVAGFIGLRISAAAEIFNRLNVFSRLVGGFLLMIFLFVAIGSIGTLQINNVVSITQELYENPMQVNNLALQIKHQVARFNRDLKDIAVDPQLIDNVDILERLHSMQQEIVQEIAVIEEKTSTTNVALLTDTFTKWQSAIIENHRQLSAGNIEDYRRNMVTNTQELTIELERLCDAIVEQSRYRMLELNSEVRNTKAQAGNLMLLVIAGSLSAGFFVSVLITRSLNGQLQNVCSAMEELAKGNTDTAIPYIDHPHEIGVMARTLAVFAENIKARKENALLLIQHQAELESSNRRLAQTNKELETFAYVASHDLKSPLRGIAQLSTWIEEDLAEQAFSEVEKHTSMLRNRIHRMERLLDDMLIFYRAGKADGKLSRVNVRQMATEIFEIQNTKPGLQLLLGNNLPEFDTLATPFEQVVRNLFSNAIKHHDLPNGVIQFECETHDDFFSFSVIDDGPGIPAKFQERVFGMFQTLRPRDELEGSGMGLALIKKLVENYGGTITVFSEGRGCRFTFTWPRAIKENENL